MKKIGIIIVLTLLLILLIFLGKAWELSFLRSYGITIIALLLLIIEIILFVKSKQIQSASLKISILLPLILTILYITSVTINIGEIGSYIMLYYAAFILPVIIISTIFSIASLIEIKNKGVALGSLIINLILLGLWVLIQIQLNRF